jgi:hypothetical protein
MPPVPAHDWAAGCDLEQRLAQPTGDTLIPEQRKERKNARLPKGYPTQAQRFQTQRRLQAPRAELDTVSTDFGDRVVHVVERGGVSGNRERAVLPASLASGR